MSLKPHVNETFTDGTIFLDNNSYKECTFVRCIFVYAGGPTEISDITLDSPKFAFDGPALNTLRLMSKLYKNGCGKAMEGAFEQIRRGMEPPPISEDDASH